MKKIVSAVLAGTIVLSSAGAGAFAAGSEDWAKEYLSYVKEKGIMNVSQGAAGAESTITGDTFLKSLAAISGEKAEDPLKWATEKKLLPAGFSSGALLSRSTAAQIAYSFMEAASLKPEKELQAQAFSDTAGLDAAAVKAIEELQKAGIVSGKGGGLFDPAGVVTEGEAAAMLTKIASLPGVPALPKEEAKWYDNLPRASWKQFPQVEVENSWFEVHKMPGDVYAIYEPGQWQEVISYLIIGKDKALLWDTGMGIGDIKACAAELTKLPITVMNSHSHMDHIGGNWQFDEIYVYDLPSAVETLTKGKTHDQVKSEVEGDSIWMETPKGFDAATYKIQGKAPTGTVKDGQIIDLGGRKLEVVYTPGHSIDAIMLIDETNKLLFTGDTYYPAPLYAFSEGADLTVYTASMNKIVDKIKSMDIQWIYSSHNEVVKGTEVLSTVAKHLEAIEKGQMKDYVKDEKGRRNYTFDDGIKIITLDVDYYK